MPANNHWRDHRTICSIKNVSRPHDRFKEALQNNLDELHKAMATYMECCQAYDQNENLIEEYNLFRKQP